MTRTSCIDEVKSGGMLNCIHHSIRCLTKYDGLDCPVRSEGHGSGTKLTTCSPSDFSVVTSTTLEYLKSQRNQPPEHGHVPAGPLSSQTTATQRQTGGIYDTLSAPPPAFHRFESHLDQRPPVMDLAYANEQIYSADRASTPTPPKEPADAPTPKPEAAQRENLSTELSETFKAFSNSPWGAKLGGFWGNVQKQSQSYYTEAVKEVEDLRVDAIKGLNNIQESLASRARSMSIDEKEAEKDAETTDTTQSTTDKAETDKQMQETETFLARFKAEAAKRLKEVQKAEDAADEALLRFGTNISNFLRDAVAVTAPDDASGSPEVLFESKDATGKRVIHTSRFDAQLHVIHTTPSGFSEDPIDSGEQWTKFKDDFNVEKKTDAVAKDLDQYAELRSTMEQLVPEKVEYADFWRRYYFLRHVLEAQEEKRKELLKGIH